MLYHHVTSACYAHTRICVVIRAFSSRILALYNLFSNTHHIVCVLGAITGRFLPTVELTRNPIATTIPPRIAWISMACCKI
jgi:hypothetical protein